MSFGDRFLKSMMGNAVRIQNEISKVVKPDIPNNCTACGVHFNVIQHRRRQCSKCKCYFCGACLIRIPVKPNSNSSNFLSDQETRVCNRCRVFSNENFSWDELMQLKVRDLVWFLERQRVCTRGLKEKEQLVELIMTCFGSDRYLADQARRQQRVAVMTCNMQSEFPSSGAQVPTDEEIEEEQEEPSAISHSPPQQQSAPDPPPPPPPPPPEYSSTVPESSDLPSQPSQESVSEPSSETPATGPSMPTTPIAENYRVYVKDLSSPEDVESLSIKQLKVLLQSNHVNYRGCCEKIELIAKAKQLVRSHLDNSRKWASAEENLAGPDAAGNEDPLEDDTCKICMDALIDCVLLECGHMVTCLECGKRMSECPICRQYVVRAVRIFKA